MKKAQLLLFVFALALQFPSCTPPSLDQKYSALSLPLETKTVTNLYAMNKNIHDTSLPNSFVKFSFSKNAVVQDDTWDIAFSGTTILVNGGRAKDAKNEPTRTGIGAISTVNNEFGNIEVVPEFSTFRQDGEHYALPTGSGNGWYLYNADNHTIASIAGKVFVVKTHDGKYAKFEILSYYKDAPASPTTSSLARYYTFRFVYQPNGVHF
jgi:HmuY protein